MPSCLLSIEFSRPDRHYHGGEKVTGWIRVEVERNVRCRNLHLAARWTTSGKTDVASGVYHRTSLFEGVWKPGERYEYPFEFEPPVGPFTWRGKNFELNHSVSVWADLPWTIETRQEAVFEVRPDPAGNQRKAIETPLPDPLTRSRPARFRTAAFELLMASFVLLASALLVIPFGAWALIGAIAAMMIGLCSLRHALSRAAMPGRRWDFPLFMVPGLPCPIHVDTGRVRWTRIREIEVVLSGHERTWSGNRGQREHHDTTLAREAYVMELNKLNNESSSGTIRGDLTVPVPDTDAWSIDLPGARVVWEFHTRVRFAWWPDLIECHEVAMIPRGHYLGPAAAENVR